MTFAERLSRFQELVVDLAAKPATGEEDPRLVELGEIEDAAAADLIVEMSDAKASGDTLRIAMLESVQAAGAAGVGARATFIATQAAAFAHAGVSERNFFRHWGGMIYADHGLAAVGDFDLACGELRAAGIWPWAK